MRYLPHSAEEIKEMLARVGVDSIDALFDSIPEKSQLGRPLAVEPALSEPELMAHLAELADKNGAAKMLSFMGAGMYSHHIPPALDQLLLRSEFYTAYTPYQAELSQGTLQAIFEFQTAVCELFGTEVANASMYDAGSAVAEAVLMARRVKRRTKCVFGAAVHPEYVETTRSYVAGLDAEPSVSVATIGTDGCTDWTATEALVDEDTAAVVIGYPNFLGCVEDLRKARTVSAKAGALLVVVVSEPYALSMIAAPGAVGADIVVGEGQALAVPPQYGGPGVGLFGCRQALVRHMPGRLVGQTLDSDGERGFVLTLSTREQHIRRERATSNICTNHGLIALAFGIRTAMLGRRGFEQVGRRCLSHSEYLKARIAKLRGLSLPYSAPTFNEFVVRSEKHTAKAIVESLGAQGILAGVDLGRFASEWAGDLLVATTETHTQRDLDRLVTALSEL